MRLLGARFDTRPDALEALRHLRSTFAVDEARVAPLADATPTATLLAGCFEEAEHEAVVTLLTSHGGEIVTDLDDRQLD